ncbi:MAG: phosphoenolpyruvate synthase [Deltaproteobacteria bacterium]|jgi:pyruvate,water dikinase|nr:phosphoenolpyruvate synthase [Deltaproteobacteria bacterium]
MTKSSQEKSQGKTKKATAEAAALSNQLILTGADVVAIGEEAELLVGGKNYNTAIISQISGIRAPQFRAVSSLGFHRLLDETRLNASLTRAVVDREYKRIDWEDPQISGDPEFLQKFVRNLGKTIRAEQVSSGVKQGLVKLRTFINTVVEGFATSPEGIDQLRKRSVLVQAAILSVAVPEEVANAVREAYLSICGDAAEEDVPVAVRSSAAGEDSRKKAFAGLQDTYLNMFGPEQVVTAYHWDCASAYNLRSMTYRREAILDAITRAEDLGDESIAQQAKKEWAIENTSLSVCIMRMINPVISGTAFAADTATGCRGTTRKDLVSIDASYGLGEAVVGGMVTPDKYYVFTRDDGHEVVIRQMGRKDLKIVYDEGGGTRKVAVPEHEATRWALSIVHAEAVAKGVRAISAAYGGIIMDSEFCIDAADMLWFVQARPETRWNEEFELHPHIIYMRRKEVEPSAASVAEILLEGNGASRGAGQGTVKFLRSALELNKISKGDVLAAERTDPDMVPGMRMASAILADVGGDTSHAAITSRELGIPAVIGIQRVEALRALDGMEVTVDGTAGKVYRGILPLRDVGGAMDLSLLPATKTRVGLILADVNQALFLSRLRTVDGFEVGLLRAEFMLGNIGVHPQALEAYDSGELEGIIQRHLRIQDENLTKTVRAQLNAGLVFLNIRLREYVGHITGLAEEIGILSEREGQGSEEEMLAIRRKSRELERKLDEYMDIASRRLDQIKTTLDLEAHVRQIMGLEDELSLLTGNDPEVVRRRGEIDVQVKHMAARAAAIPFVQATLDDIRELREDVAHRTGIVSQREGLRDIPAKIGEIVQSRGYRSGREHYVQTLAQGLALFAMAFYGRDIIYRTTDFKSNEYRNLLGGLLFEQIESNPMLGWRGVSRNLHDWELEAFKLARGVYGGTNLQIMLPFVRTLEEARSMRRYLEQVHKLKSGQDGLKIILMAEIPSNAILAKQYLEEFDGFSIGSNDMTQMVLATDRDNAKLSHIYDEEDPAVIWAILVTIFSGQKYGKKVGFCGQGVSNSTILRGLVAIAGIASASVVPDTFYQTKLDMAEVEQENIPAPELGAWLQKQHLALLHQIMEEHGYGHILKKYNKAEDLLDWYEGELNRLQEHLRESLDTSKERFYRQELDLFRRGFHKPVIYSNWDWPSLVADALHQAGFASFEEQATALEAWRAKFNSR